MTRRAFSRDVYLEILVGGNSVLVTAEISFTTTPLDPGVSSGPAELCYPPEGNEIDDREVTALYMPEVKAEPARELDLEDGDKLQIAAIDATPRLDLECPAWLAQLILENVDDETLNEAADFDGDDREYERE